ncbi:hemolysin XhlA family protein [Mesobacillus zeae]|uniref:Holin n=1 Tax=Mesobacillus zeae TaxID=1917180 RepID=A0A398BKA4_9BACI|nr:hemolysin XhlA family protein [Mesobacillus zeae]RID88928.1 holin [Mesobacillus zeae]
MAEPISRDIAEIREWLVRIDTKMDYMNEVKHTAEEAKVLAEEAKQIATEAREDIRDMKANTKWVWGVILTVVGLLITVGIAVFR